MRYAASYPCAPMSAGRLARSSGVACHGLVQLAEGLLDAGVDVARTLGAVLDGRGWLGRELRQPGPGLVGDRTGLVALGQWKRSSGSGGRESAMTAILVAVRVGGQAGAEVRGELPGAGPGGYTFCLLPGRVDLRVP